MFYKPPELLLLLTVIASSGVCSLPVMFKPSEDTIPTVSVQTSKSSPRPIVGSLLFSPLSDLNIAVVTASSALGSAATVDSSTTTTTLLDSLPLQYSHAQLFMHNKQEWAHYHSYDYIQSQIELVAESTGEVSAAAAAGDQSDDDGLSDAHAAVALALAKLELISSSLATYDWIVWLDFDTLVLDFQLTVQQHLSQQSSNIDLLVHSIHRSSSSLSSVVSNPMSFQSSFMIVRNSPWTNHLLARMRAVLQDWLLLNHCTEFLISQSNSLSPSWFDNVLSFVLSADTSMSTERHVAFKPLLYQHSQFAYMPRISVIHFNGCSLSDEQCATVFQKAVEYLLGKENLLVWTLGPRVQHIYNIFVVIYCLFALDRLGHILARIFIATPKVPFKTPDETKLSTVPVVVVQLPMFNETSCCHTIIDASCQLKWPLSRFHVQIVDDSTLFSTIQLIDDRVAFWKSRGVSITVHRRDNRLGFKAGAMNEAMDSLAAYDLDAFDASTPDKGTKYICIFDADFIPAPEFLHQTVPALEGDDKLAFVQTRWVYTNSKESILTRMQEISLNFHFHCEQESRYKAGLFFNFNGTAGVWRKEAIDSVGGWHVDTLVEDMDLSLRVYTAGWKMCYLKHVECYNEIPPTFDAYRGQQHRWTSGPMQLLRKGSLQIFQSRVLPWYKKLFCWWFFIRNYVHLVNFVYFLVLIPLMIWIPRVMWYEWAVVYLPVAISITNILFTPDEWHSAVFYVIFENSMCLFKSCALISGILNIGKAKQWIVTPKFARKKLAKDPSLLLQSYSSPIPPLKYGCDDAKPEKDEDPDGFMLADLSTSSTLNSDSSLSLTQLSRSKSDMDVPELQSDCCENALFDVDHEAHRTRFVSLTALSPFPRVVPTTMSVNDQTVDDAIPEEPFIKTLYKAYQMSKYLNPRLTFHWSELTMGCFLFGCGYFGLLMGQVGIAWFSILNFIGYFCVGFGYLGRGG